MVEATVPTQPMAAVNTEPMEVSRELTVTAATSVVQQRSFLLMISKQATHDGNDHGEAD